jgi:hypothetical protein
MVNFMAIWSDFIVVSWDLPSGKLSHNYGKIHHFSWENPLFLWWFSIVMLVYQRVTKQTWGYNGIPFGNQTWLALVSWKIPGGWGTWRCFFGKIIYTWGIFHCHTVRNRQLTQVAFFRCLKTG